MNGYCGDCDKQIEFNSATVTQHTNVNGDVIINLRCEWCNEEELIAIIET